MKLNPMIVLREDFENMPVLFNPDDGELLSLNTTSLFIWKQLSGDISRDELISRIHQACGDSFPKEAEKDIDLFLDRMKRKGYIQD